MTSGACGGGTEPTAATGPGMIDLTVSTTGVDLDTNGYSLTLDATPIHVGVNDIEHVPVAAGRHQVALAGVSHNCIANATALTPDVASGRSTAVTFHITCGPRQGVFSSDRAGGGLTLWIINSDGSGLKQLLTVDGDVPAGWSPDGSKLTFTRNGLPKRQIFIMNADGTAVQQLTTGNFNSSGGTWSPDGTRLVFTSDRDGNTELYTMKIDGTDVRRLTNTRGTEASPQWSPVGPFISYTFDSDTTPVLGYSSEAVIMNVDDGTTTRPFAGNIARTTPIWSPDGQKLLFLQQVGTTWNFKNVFNLWVGNVAGASPPQQITFDTLNVRLGRYSLDGNTITYSRQAYYKPGAIGWETRMIGTDGVDRRFPEGSTFQDYNLIWRP